MNDLAAVLEQAHQARANQDRLRAHSLYVQATQLSTKSTAAWAGRAATAVDLDDAIISLSNVLVLIPHDPIAREMLAQRVQERIAQSTSSDAKDLVALGRALAQVQEKSLAHQLFVCATQLDDRYEAGWLWRGSSTEDLDEALKCMEQALAINPGNHAAQQARQLLRLRKSQASQQATVPTRSPIMPPAPAAEPSVPAQPAVLEVASAETLASTPQPEPTPTQTSASIQMPAVEPIDAQMPLVQTLPQIPTPPAIESTPVRPMQTESAPAQIHASVQTPTTPTTLLPQQPTVRESTPTSETTPIATQALEPVQVQTPKRALRPPPPIPPPVILPIEVGEPTSRTHLILLIISIILLILIVVNYLQKFGYIR